MERTGISIPELELRHRRWRVWQAEESGTWCASVRRNLTARQQQEGAVPYLQADGPDELERLLAAEEAKCPDGALIRVQVRVWGRTGPDIEDALEAAGAGGSRAGWQAADVALFDEDAWPFLSRDGNAIAAARTPGWAYVVYRADA